MYTIRYVDECQCHGAALAGVTFDDDGAMVEAFKPCSRMTRQAVESIPLCWQHMKGITQPGSRTPMVFDGPDAVSITDILPGIQKAKYGNGIKVEGEAMNDIEYLVSYALGLREVIENEGLIVPESYRFLAIRDRHYVEPMKLVTASEESHV